VDDGGGDLRMPGTIWDGVDRLVDAAPGVGDLRSHGLHLLAARRWRILGRPVPASLAEQELRAVYEAQAVGPLLERIRAAVEGPIVLMKGPVVAGRYPDPLLRPFQDLDLLVTDAAAAQANLLASGFAPSLEHTLDADNVHHLHPLRLPDLPLEVEVHSRPKWVNLLEPPSVDDLLEGAEPAALGVDGILTFEPTYHALILAAHLWAHDPLTRLLRVVDVAAMAEASERREIDALAEAWGLTRLWRTTMAVADTLLLGAEGRPWPLRTWARNLSTARETTVLELHLGRCLGAFSVLPPRRAIKALAAALAGCLRPQPDESWRRKLRRTARQLVRPSMRRSEHAGRIKADSTDGKATRLASNVTVPRERRR
jgi:hypothetical protein